MRFGEVRSSLPGLLYVLLSRGPGANLSPTPVKPIPCIPSIIVYIVLR